MVKRCLLTFFFLIVMADSVRPQTLCPLENLKPKIVGSLDSFQKLPVLDEGRIKPLDTYARNLLLQFSGKTTVRREPAVDWTARLLLAPTTTLEDKVFLINHPDILTVLGISAEKKRRYSFSRIEPGLTKLEALARAAARIKEEQRTIVDKEMLRLYNALALYVKLSQVFSFAFPDADFQIDRPETLARLQLPQGKKMFSFLDIALKADILHEATDPLGHNDPHQKTDADRELMGLLSNLYQWHTYYQDHPLAVIPSRDARDESWLSPWDAIAGEFPDQSIRAELVLWRDLMVAYWNGQQTSFDLAAQALGRSMKGRVSGHEGKALKKIPLELFYNQSNFFGWAKLFYGIAFALFLLGLFFKGSFWRRAALVSVFLGLVPHAWALVLRALIMGRPPVTNLYETFIFVGFVGVCLGVIVEWLNKCWLGILVAGLCGGVFLCIADKFSAEGDTLRMLGAVLDSNFWLSTHVLTISMGYAGCCVAGIVGHFYILQRVLHPQEDGLLQATYQNLQGILLFGLMMTFLGTVLGGIWADQSWGRFWGWDPKENGALLIILWCAIIVHAKVGRMIGPVGVAVGSILGVVVVMWAWFGVNLLNIGLHSYGFTSGVASGLLVYGILEAVFLGICVPPLILPEWGRKGGGR
ncbi:MAG: hypothetical protein A2Z81_03195 [Omnitrophica WOR_2 bacterium GWA2_45_18]|nr:MAG: hypothetical protein A2Z81_03195 [Omnitrophica WOR_2 bacterium GWA2_45_18]